VIENFEVLAHADWSVRKSGRWLVTAEPSKGRWRINEPVMVNVNGLLGDDIGIRGMLGVDVPIGVPIHWAKLVKIDCFLRALKNFGEGCWVDTLHPAVTADQISLFRPFYPHKTGGAKQVHILKALDACHINLLRRHCDFDQEGRPAASPLFWTLGAAQVGKAAIDFWLSVLRPAVLAEQVHVWPFHGTLDALANKAKPIVAETYPGEAYSWFNLEITKKNRSKRRIDDRLLDSQRLLEVVSNLDFDLEPNAEEQVINGFKNGGEDAFDAFVGLLAVVSVVKGHRPEPEIRDDAVRQTEGWILGRKPGSLTFGMMSEKRNSV
jgi:hypothetical protein